MIVSLKFRPWKELIDTRLPTGGWTLFRVIMGHPIDPPGLLTVGWKKGLEPRAIVTPVSIGVDSVRQFLGTVKSVGLIDSGPKSAKPEALLLTCGLSWLTPWSTAWPMFSALAKSKESIFRYLHVHFTVQTSKRCMDFFEFPLVQRFSWAITLQTLSVGVPEIPTHIPSKCTSDCLQDRQPLELKDVMNPWTILPGTPVNPSGLSCFHWNMVML